MSTTSRKHQAFVGKPMHKKRVTSLPGIGKAMARRLEKQGFDRASELLGQFLLMQRDTEMFMKWLKDTSGANSREARSCTRCLSEWCDAFL